MIDKYSAPEGAPGGARRVVVLGTGGTIAGRAAEPGDNLGYRAGEVGVGELLAGIAVPGVALQAEQVANIDSKDMDGEVWRALALRCAHWLAQDDVAGIVVTHGTDTLEETAFFLHSVLAPQRPVVLACAMRPATALSPDGPQNLRDAIHVAAMPGLAGVLAVCAGTIHGAQAVQKVHTYRLDAFSSGDLGPVGVVEEGCVVLAHGGPGAPQASPAREAMQRIAAGAPWPRVEIVLSHAGTGGLLVDALLRERAESPATGVQGIVLAGTGNATLHRELEAAAARAQAAGVAVVRATRCAFGRVLPASEAGALPDAGGLSPVKARIALMLSLMRAG